MFADDTAIFTSHNNHEKGSYNLQKSLNTVQEYFERWRIKLNKNKTAHITIEKTAQTSHSVAENSQHEDSLRYPRMQLNRKQTGTNTFISKGRNSVSYFARFNGSSEVTLNCP